MTWLDYALETPLCQSKGVQRRFAEYLDSEEVAIVDALEYIDTYSEVENAKNSNLKSTRRNLLRKFIEWVATSERVQLHDRETGVISPEQQRRVLAGESLDIFQFK